MCYFRACYKRELTVQWVDPTDIYIHTVLPKTTTYYSLVKRTCVRAKNINIRCHGSICRLIVSMSKYANSGWRGLWSLMVRTTSIRNKCPHDLAIS